MKNSGKTVGSYMKNRSTHCERCDFLLSMSWCIISTLLFCSDRASIGKYIIKYIERWREVHNKTDVHLSQPAFFNHVRGNLEFPTPSLIHFNGEKVNSSVIKYIVNVNSRIAKACTIYTQIKLYHFPCLSIGSRRWNSRWETKRRSSLAGAVAE